MRLFIVVYIVLGLWMAPLYAQEICNNCMDDDGDGLIDCYDPDCRNDTAFCQNFYLGILDSSTLNVCTDHFELIEMWRYQGPSDITIVLAADIDKDGNTEVYFNNYTTGYNIITLNGSTGVPKYTYSEYSFGSCIGDVDKDGFAEIFGYKIAGSSRQVVRYPYMLSPPVWVSDSIPIFPNFQLSLADFDEDGIPEVYVGGFILNAVTGDILISANAQIDIVFLAGNHPLPAIAADVLPDNYCLDCRGLELINGKNIFAVNLDAGTLTLISSAPSSMPQGPAAVADMDNDGSLDIIVNAADVLYIYNPVTGNLVGGLFDMKGYLPDSIRPLYSVPLIGNFDNDPIPEIGLIEIDRLLAIDDDMSVKWENMDIRDQTQSNCPPVLFDFNCNGIPEVVARGADGQIHIVSGYDGQTLSSAPCSSGTGMEYPIIADINNDGHADIVCACRDGAFTGIKAWTGAAPNNWSASRNVWNQYGYFNVNINDDLSVPCGQQDHGDPKLPPQLNAFLSQVPLFDEHNQACTKNPVFVDAVMQIDTMIYLECDKVNILYSVCNAGTDSIIAAGTYYSIYNGSGLSREILLMDSIPVALTPGQCWSSNIIMDANGQHLYFYGNDNGSNIAYPPAFTFKECDYYNNMADITLLYRCDTVTDDSVFNSSQWIYIPNAFSPNGDGINDYLTIRTQGVEKIHFTVFNRFSRKVYETTSLDTYWDGKLYNHPLDNGIYIWHASVIFTNDKEEISFFKGNVEIIK